MRSTNDQPPLLGPRPPVYPVIGQVCRVYGPAQPGNVYPAYIQQQNAPNATLRDREDVLLWEPNLSQLVNGGKYVARLVGAYMGLPLLVTHCCRPGSSSSLSSSVVSSSSSELPSSSLLSSSLLSSSLPSLPSLPSSSIFSSSLGSLSSSLGSLLSSSLGSLRSSESSQFSKSSFHSGSSLSSIGGVCFYRVTATLDWNSVGPGAHDHPDLDLYAKNLTDGGVCYYAAPAAGGFALNYDAWPDCAVAPDPPEITVGVFEGDHRLSFWYNQHSNCVGIPAPAKTARVEIENLGLVSILVDGVIIIPPGGFATVLSSFAYAGFNTGDQSGFTGGTEIDIQCVESSLSSTSSGPGVGCPCVAIVTVNVPATGSLSGFSGACSGWNSISFGGDSSAANLCMWSGSVSGGYFFILTVATDGTGAATLFFTGAGGTQTATYGGTVAFPCNSTVDFTLQASLGCPGQWPAIMPVKFF